MGIDNVRNNHPAEVSTASNISAITNDRTLANAAHVDAIAVNVFANEADMTDFDALFDAFDATGNDKLDVAKTNEAEAEMNARIGDLEEEMGKTAISQGAASEAITYIREEIHLRQEEMHLSQEEIHLSREAEGLHIQEMTLDVLLKSANVMTHVKFLHFEGKSVLLKNPHDLHPDLLKEKLDKREFAVVKGKELHVDPESKFAHGKSMKIMVDGVEQEFTVKHLSAADLKQLSSVITNFIAEQNQPKTTENKDTHTLAKHETHTGSRDKPHTIVVLSSGGRAERQRDQQQAGGEKAPQKKVDVNQTVLAQEEAKIKEERQLKKEEIAIERLLRAILRDIEHRLIANSNLALENCKRDHSFAQITHEQIVKHQKTVSAKS